MSAKIPPATLRALKALDAADGKRLPYANFRRESGVKTRAYYPFVQRLLNQSLICEYGDLTRSQGYEITFTGLRAIGKA